MEPPKLRLMLLDAQSKGLDQPMPIVFRYRHNDLTVFNDTGLSWAGLTRPPASFLILAPDDRVIYCMKLLSADDRLPFTGRLFINRGWIEFPVRKPGSPGDLYVYEPQPQVSG